MGLINKAIKFVFDRNYRFLALDQRGVYNSMDDRKYLERKYESIFNIKLDLENPKTFNRKCNGLNCIIVDQSLHNMSINMQLENI